MGEVDGRGDADDTRATPVQVAQLVGDHLQLVRGEARLVVQHVVVRRTNGPLKPNNATLQWSYMVNTRRSTVEFGAAVRCTVLCSDRMRSASVCRAEPVICASLASALKWEQRKKSNLQGCVIKPSTTVPGWTFLFPPHECVEPTFPSFWYTRPSGTNSLVWWRFWTTTNVIAGLYSLSISVHALRIPITSSFKI